MAIWRHPPLRGTGQRPTLDTVTSPPPPIRIMTRLLAELQTSILSRGLHLTDGDIDRFAILSLVIRQTGSGAEPAKVEPRRIPTLSLANSLSKPYETARRHVGRLVESGLCERGPGGIGIARDPAARAALDAALVHAHDAFVRFVDDLRGLGVPMPRARAPSGYRAAAGLEAAVDVMLSVLDGNRSSHAGWVQLVIFSAILSVNTDGFARDPAKARAFADETRPMPGGMMRPVTTVAVARLLDLPETTARRQVDAMLGDGRVLRVRAGLIVSEAWLNQPDNVEVSRNSFNNLRRILERLASRDFPFDAPASAYVVGRPADVSAGLRRRPARP